MTFIAIVVACAVACAVIANSKNRNGGGWFVIGLVTGFIGLIVIACLPTVKAREAVKVCPKCAEEVKLAAVVCRHCGHDFTPPARKPLPTTPIFDRPPT